MKYPSTNITIHHIYHLIYQHKNTYGSSLYPTATSLPDSISFDLQFLSTIATIIHEVFKEIIELCTVSTYHLFAYASEQITCCR